MNFIDLHTHSYMSDGTFSPTEVVKKAKEANLYALGLTDHDTIDGVEEAIEAAKKIGIKVIPGVEVSCAYKKKEVHILGYVLGEVKADNIFQNIKAWLKVFEEQRDSRNYEILDNFRNAGFDIEENDLYVNNEKTMITRLHFANALLKKGYVSNIQEAFDKYLGIGQDFVPEKKTKVKDAMEFFKANNMFISLAHAYRYSFSEEELETLIKELTDMGMQGLEVYYTTHTEENVTNLRRLAKLNNLLPTGGSDFHGDNKPKIAIGKGFGNLRIPKSILDDIEKSFIK